MVREVESGITVEGTASWTMFGIPFKANCSSIPLAETSTKCYTVFTGGKKYNIVFTIHSILAPTAAN